MLFRSLCVGDLTCTVGPVLNKWSELHRVVCRCCPEHPPGLHHPTWPTPPHLAYTTPPGLHHPTFVIQRGLLHYVHERERERDDVHSGCGLPEICGKNADLRVSNHLPECCCAVSKGNRAKGHIDQDNQYNRTPNGGRVNEYMDVVQLDGDRVADGTMWTCRRRSYSCPSRCLVQNCHSYYKNSLCSLAVYHFRVICVLITAVCADYSLGISCPVSDKQPWKARQPLCSVYRR